MWEGKGFDPRFSPSPEAIKRPLPLLSSLAAHLAYPVP